MTGTSKIELPPSGLAEEILSGLVARAQGAADREAKRAAVEAPRESHHLVTFSLGGECYGVAIESVQEIIRAEGITAVPGAPADVCGVINLRGRIIPVIDLGKRFRIPAPESAGERRIMVVEVGARRLGMLVDAVSQVIKVPAASVEELPEEAVRVEERYLRGVGKLENTLVFIIDLGRSLLAGHTEREHV